MQPRLRARGRTEFPVGLRGSTSVATRLTLGAISLSSSSHLVAVAGSKWVNPVTLRPGRARLSAKPSATGSDISGNTIGMVRVSFMSAEIEGGLLETITSGVSPSNSAT